MTHPLDGAWAKIARAKEHFQVLEAEIGSPADYADPITFAQEFDADAGTIKVTTQGVPELPFRWALVAADALQNLRAALNYLAWELARWNLAQRGEIRDPANRTQFPIHTTPRDFDNGMVRDIHPDHAAIIKSLQPNGARFLSNFSEIELQSMSVQALARRSPLGVIVRLTNDDKHKALQVALIRPSEVQFGPYEAVDCTITHTYITPNLALENGAEWVTFDVTPTGPQPKVKVNDKITAQIAISGWNVRGAKWLLDSVTEIVGSADWPL